MQRAEYRVVSSLLFARDIRDRAANQLQQQPLIIGFGVQAALVVPIPFG